MSCALTEYRKPRPHYGLEGAGWMAHTPWELVDGRWRRLYVLAHHMTAKRRWRRAEVFRRDGAWAWRVLERRGYGEWAEVARMAQAQPRPHLTAHGAMPYAELAAETR